MIALLIVLSVLLGSTGVAGTITGTVRAEGKKEADKGSAGGKYASHRYKFVERVNYATLGDFVVYIDQVLTNTPGPPRKPVQVITQKDATFNPHVLPIMAGTTVEWPNHDDIFHNVFSMSETKPFDLGLYKDPEIKKVTFDKVGRIDVFCSIHSRMSCIVLVLPNPYFASVDSDGKYTISGIPPGTYKIKAWHERLPSQVKEVAVSAEGETRADFTLGITNLPGY